MLSPGSGTEASGRADATRLPDTGAWSRHGRFAVRNTHWISWLGYRIWGTILAGGLCFCSWGCHQHYYYYGTPAGGVQGCPPGTTIMPSAVTTGPVCDVPANGATTSDASRSTMISDGRRSRVVVSTPSNGQSSRFGWRPTDPESTPAITSVEGAYQDSSVKK
jgi:hypothetical protein